MLALGVVSLILGLVAAFFSVDGWIEILRHLLRIGGQHGFGSKPCLIMLLSLFFLTACVCVSVSLICDGLLMILCGSILRY